MTTKSDFIMPFALFIGRGCENQMTRHVVDSALHDFLFEYSVR